MTDQDLDLSMYTDFGETKFRQSPLLSLPPEIRHMIWKAVADTDLILLFGKFYMRGAPLRFAALDSVCIPPTYIDGRCSGLHQHPPSKSNSRPTYPPKRSKAPGPLSWLRTNRQIYTEAHSIFRINLKLHICDALVFSRFLSHPQDSVPNPSTIRSISFCLKIVIESDLRDSFFFTRGRSRVAHGWEPGHGVCACLRCFAMGGRTDGLRDQLPALRELGLRMYFMCRPRQGNTRPVIGQLVNGRPRKGQLYRPKNPTALALVDDSGRVEEFVEDFCDRRPLRILSKERLESVDVRFCTERIEHDPMNDCPHPRDRCWCKGRSIDKESLQRSDVAREIRKRLMG